MERETDLSESIDQRHKAKFRGRSVAGFPTFRAIRGIAGSRTRARPQPG